jgi:hypothetical protein
MKHEWRPGAALASWGGVSRTRLRPVRPRGPVPLGYAVLIASAMVTFVIVYEQPSLTAQFDDEYTTYCRAVPGWWPRLTPWRPER